MMILANHIIHAVDGLYSLNDLHTVSGGEKRHQPSNWLRTNQAQEIIAELKSEAFSSSNVRSLEPVRVIRGVQADNAPQGTYACKELVYSYAMWVSARFHLIVIRAFDAMVKHNHHLGYRFNYLCRELDTLEKDLTNAGRFLSVGGKQTKPKIERAIEQTLAKMQLELPLSTANSITCQQMTTYLDQDDKLNTLDNDLLNGDLGGDDDK